jgi:hypothetical protein
VDEKTTIEELDKLLWGVDAPIASEPYIVLNDWQLHVGALCVVLRMGGIDVTPMLQALVDQLPDVPGVPSYKTPKRKRR